MVLAQGDTTTVMAAAIRRAQDRLRLRPRRGRPACVLARAARRRASHLRRRAGRSAVRADPHRGREPHARARQRQGHPDRQHRARCAARAPAATCRQRARATACSSRCIARRRSTIRRSSARSLAALDRISREMPVLWPVHPRTVAKVAEAGLVFPRVHRGLRAARSYRVPRARCRRAGDHATRAAYRKKRRFSERRA